MSGTSNSTSSSLVANPMYTALQQLYTQLQRDAPTMSDALKSANQQMASNNVWVGPAARSWASQLDGYARDCASQVNAMLADVEQALASEPAQVAPQVAEQKSRVMVMLERGAFGY